MKKKFLYFTMSTALSGITPQSAYALSEAYAPTGISIGSFHLLPVMSLANEYNSNIYQRDKGGEVSSYIAHFKPGFELSSDWTRHLVSTSLNTDIAVFSNQNTNNTYQDVLFNLTGRLDITRNSYLQTMFDYNYLHGQRGSPDQNNGITPTFYDQKILDLSYFHRFNRLSLSPAFNLKRSDYRDTATLTGTLLSNTRSRTEYMPSIRLAYEIKPGYNAFSKFIWKEVAYDTGVFSNTTGKSFQRDSSGYNILGGLNFEITRLVSGEVSLGYLYRKYPNDVRLKTISGVNGFINIDWQPTELTDIVLAFSRDINETTQSGVSGTISNSPSITIEHELMRNVIVKTGFNYNHLEYNGFDPATATKNRIGNYYGVNIGAEYLLNRYFSMGLTYGYKSRGVNLINANYNIHKVMFSIKGQI